MSFYFFEFIINIRIQRINPQIQDVLVAQARGRFDPVISLGSDADWSEQPSLTPFITGADVRTSNTQGFVFGFDDPIFTGGSYGMYSLFESVRGRLQSKMAVRPTKRFQINIAASSNTVGTIRGINSDGKLREKKMFPILFSRKCGVGHILLNQGMDVGNREVEET